jgi:hypothetical protein
MIIFEVGKAYDTEIRAFINHDACLALLRNLERGERVICGFCCCLGHDEWLILSARLPSTVKDGTKAVYM